nr:hypothetical protein [uncultured Oscillibacter sp.]
MNDIMRPVYGLLLIVSGGCFAMMWLFACVPPKDSKSPLSQTQIMVQSDGVWKFLLYTVMAAAAVMFLFSFVSLLATL